TRQQRRLADEIDDDLKHIDVRRLARSALPESAWPQRLGERANLAVEILAGEGVRAHDRSLAHAQLADVALLALCPDPQCREVPDHDQRALGRRCRSLAGL